MTAAKAKARSYRALLKARIRDTSVSMEARSLWILIESYADHDGKNAFPSTPTLASIAGHEVRWVERYLRELRVAGWITVGKRPKKGGGFSNIYSLHHPQNWGDAITPKMWVVHHPQKGGKTGYQFTVGADVDQSAALNPSHDEESPFPPTP